MSILKNQRCGWVPDDPCCNCPGWKWEVITKGPRGENMPQCSCCGKAIMGRGYDGSRYFAAILERACECLVPQYPKRVSYHQVYCSCKKGD
jgi:hypothetical protein